MKVFLKNSEINIELERGDDFKKIISKIKSQLQPYSYDLSTKYWTTKKINLLIFDQVFQEEKINYSYDVIKLMENQKNYLKKLENVKNKLYENKIDGIKANLLKHQKQAINCLISQKNFGLFDEQGLGKTLSTISTISVLFEKNLIDKCIIICPNILKLNWYDEIKKFSNLTQLILSGDKKNKIEMLEQNSQIIITNFEALIFKKPKDKVLTENEKLSKKFQNKFKKIVNERTCIVIDEAHRIKSGSSKISKFIRKLGKQAIYKYPLTGTPVANKPEDVFYLFLFLDEGNLFGTNFEKFMRQYSYIGGWYFSIRDFKNKNPLNLINKINYFKFNKTNFIEMLNEIIDDFNFFDKWKENNENLLDRVKYFYDKYLKYKNNNELYSNIQEIKKINRHLLEITYPNECPINDYLWSKFSEKTITGYKNLDKLKFLVDLKSLRRRKHEVLDLPEKIIENRIIEISEDHLRFYNKLKKGILQKREENGEISDIDNCLIRLIQAATNPLLLDENCNITNNKIKELDNLLEEHIENSENKVVLWTTFIDNFDYLLKRYEKYNPVHINGRVKDEERYKNKNLFQSDPNVKLIICNPQACKEGITLTSSCVAIYLNRDFNLVNYKQSTDRIHRIGQTKTCLIINLIFNNTIDEIISENLYIKDILASYIQGDIKKLDCYNLMSNRELLEKSLS